MRANTGRSTRPPLRSRLSDEGGASLVEYALLVALIAVVCIAAVTFLGTSDSSKFDKAGSAIGGSGAPDCGPGHWAWQNPADGQWICYPGSGP